MKTRIEEGWAKYRDTVVPTDVTPAEMRNLRWTFYAGVIWFYKEQVNAGDSQTGFDKLIDDIEEEINSMVAEVELTTNDLH